MSLKKILYKRFPFIPATNLFIGRRLHAIKVKQSKKV